MQIKKALPLFIVGLMLAAPAFAQEGGTAPTLPVEGGALKAQIHEDNKQIREDHKKILGDKKVLLDDKHALRHDQVDRHADKEKLEKARHEMQEKRVLERKEMLKHRSKP